MADPKRLHLTDAVVRKLLPPAQDSEITWDTADVPGFGIRVACGGAKAFVFNYRTKGTGRGRRFTIGRYPSWSVSTARAKAKSLRRIVDEGGDPVGDAETDRAAPTMADLIERYRQEQMPSNPGTAVNYGILIEKHIRPALKHLKVADVDYAAISALHRKVSKFAPYAGNRALAVLSSMFNSAILWKWRVDNPCRGIKKNSELKRKRYTEGEELTRLTEALAAHPDRQAADIIRLLLLTGARRGEIFAMRWDNIDLKTGLWAKPASSTKQAEDHEVPLSAPARQVLAEIAAKQKPGGTFVFPSDGKTGHVVEIKRSWRTLCQVAGIRGLRVHDLRHSFASQLASAGASLPLIGALLGHSNPSTTHRYSHLFQDPQRAAVEKVGAIIGAAGKPAEEPVAFPVKGGRRGRR